MPPGLIHENQSAASKSVMLAEAGVTEPSRGAGGRHVDGPGGPEESQGTPLRTPHHPCTGQDSGKERGGSEVLSSAERG